MSTLSTLSNQMIKTLSNRMINFLVDMKHGKHTREQLDKILKYKKNKEFEQLFKKFNREIKRFVGGDDPPNSNVLLSEEIYGNLQEAGIVSFAKIRDNFENFEISDKIGASNSVMIRAKYKRDPNQIVYFKIYWEPNHPSGKAELEMYNNIFKLSKYDITPNLLCRVFAGNLPYYMDFSKETTEFQDLMNSGDNSNPDIIRSEVLVIMTLFGGKTLEEIVESRDRDTSLTPDDIRAILFQIIYTIYIFGELGICHGDLHLGNIFIQDIPISTLNYMVNGQKFSFETKKLVKIYDWDFGSIMKDISLKNGDKLDKVDNIIYKNMLCIEDRYRDLEGATQSEIINYAYSINSKFGEAIQTFLYKKKSRDFISKPANLSLLSLLMDDLFATYKKTETSGKIYTLDGKIKI